MVGRRYTWKKQPCTVIVQWRTGHGKGGPRNVGIRLDDGQLVCVHVRALRKVKDG
jgi:hypothetical protein